MTTVSIEFDLDDDLVDLEVVGRYAPPEPDVGLMGEDFEVDQILRDDVDIYYDLTKEQRELIAEKALEAYTNNDDFDYLED